MTEEHHGQQGGEPHEGDAGHPDPSQHDPMTEEDTASGGPAQEPDRSR